MVVESKRVTLTEVALAAGTSTAAVSYALNNQPGVSDDTRTHILETAERIGYQRRESHRLATHQWNVRIALSPTRHHGETPNYYVAELLAGADQEARQRGVTLNAEFWSSSWDRAVANRADGVLFLGGAFDPAAIAEVKAPVTLVGTSFPELEVDSVLADNYLATFVATSHVIAKGSTRPLLLNGPQRAATTSGKTAGFRDALLRANIPFNEALVAYSTFDSEASEHVAHAILVEKDRPDSIVAGDDVIAFGVLHAAQTLGLDIPGDLRVIGFGDSPTAELIRPSLSSIRIYLHQMGRIGMRRLIDRLDSPDQELPVIRSLVSPRLVERASTGGKS